MMHNVFYPSRERANQGYLYRPKIQWKDAKQCNNILVQLAWSEYQRSGCLKVPRWILSFSLHHLSQGPLPSPAIVTDCLSIVAIDLGCTFSDITTPNERYVEIRQILTFLTKAKCTTGPGFEPDNPETRKLASGWRRGSNRIQAQGYHRVLPICGLGRAVREWYDD